MKIKKGDKVKILAGKDRGKDGSVLRVLPTDGKIVVEGINLVKKHHHSKKTGEKGQRISVPAPMNVSNAQVICSKCGKPSRIGYKITDGNKFRICKKCNAEI